MQHGMRIGESSCSVIDLVHRHTQTKLLGKSTETMPLLRHDFPWHSTIHRSTAYPYVFAVFAPTVMCSGCLASSHIGQAMKLSNNDDLSREVISLFRGAHLAAILQVVL